ncbi:RNA recognition motif domain-containing protein [Geoalkalibacter halelectricus]|uniref:RNA-binding protein n=1 Tax=Geoalkalibacter halelectricus TaxID=2847045 RepID=A0ABY5ZIM8_9BACT|nr:RNA-binding protein [Geoalkalibacter halelectricus]MDO3377296.1 RNA-binding protein [Geoalkalibacter halelectricus]UWZ78933.1 RNA-binding protein [Geoalkalibacter halelectricus]
MKDQSLDKDLFVSDISLAAKEEDLHKLFAICGKVKSVHLLTDQKSGQFNGCAFVRMATAAEAKDALNMLDGTRLLNRCIRIKAARPKPSAPPAEAQPTEQHRRPRHPRGRRK